MEKHYYYEKLVSVLLCVCLIGVGSSIFYSSQAAEAKQKLRFIEENSNAHMVSALSSLETAIAKAKYSTGDMRNKLLAEIMRESTKISTCLEAVPLDENGMQETQKFASQVGAYALSLIGAEAGGEDFEMLSQLENIAKNPFNYGVVAASASEKLGENEYPALIYDGPYSEHISKRKPEFLHEKAAINVEKAAEIAEKLTALPKNSFKITECFGAKIPYFLAESGDYSLEISRIGGSVINFVCGREIGEIRLSCEEGAKAAAAFMAKHNEIPMKQTYFELSGNYITVNFAAIDGDIVLYPDLIKLTVALDNGEIIGAEAHGFIMNHHERKIPQANISAEAAQAKVSDDLKILSHNIAIIPTDGEHEKLCYEFICQTSKQTHCLVYISAETGKEQNILLLLETENGTLTA